MKDKIEIAIEYYNFKKKEIVDCINRANNLSVEQIIEKGEELSILEYKITALEVAKEN